MRSTQAVTAPAPELLIKEVIDRTDYCLVIVGGRYGSTTPVSLSYTEKEYDSRHRSAYPSTVSYIRTPELYQRT